jgi:hypothetical protein
MRKGQGITYRSGAGFLFTAIVLRVHRNGDVTIRLYSLSQSKHRSRIYVASLRCADESIMTKMLLKAKLRRLYMRIMSEADDMSCGAHLAGYIRPRNLDAIAEFNLTLVKLQKIDPEARHLKPMN